MSTHAHTAVPYPHATTWLRRIANARVRGTFTDAERDMAGGWNKCAIGERFSPDSDDEWFAPRAAIHDAGFTVAEASQLINIGAKFALVVDRDDFDQAEQIVRAINKARPGRRA